MSRSLDYYDRKGRPISMEQFVEFHRQNGYLRVGDDRTEKSRISTVWLGMDHAWGDGPPLIFETLVFGGPLAQTMNRYSTEEQAIAGHDQMVMKVRDAERQFDSVLSLPEVAAAVATLNEAIAPIVSEDASRDDLLRVIFDTLTPNQKEKA